MKTETGHIYIAHDEVKFLSEEECQSYELTHLAKGCRHLNNEELIQLIRLILNIGINVPHEIKISLPPDGLEALIAEHAIYFEAIVMEDQGYKYVGLFGGRNDFEMLDLSGALVGQEAHGGWFFSIRQIFEFVEDDCRLFVPSSEFVLNPDITPTLLTIYNNLIEL
jgi:hypothetical protein